MEDAPNTDISDDISFEDAYRRLEGIVRALETGRTDLETSLVSFEKGVKLVKICRAKLEGAARRIEILKGIDENGDIVVEPIDEKTLTSPVESAGRQTRAVQQTSESSASQISDSASSAPGRAAVRRTARNSAGSPERIDDGTADGASAGRDKANERGRVKRASDDRGDRGLDFFGDFDAPPF